MADRESIEVLHVDDDAMVLEFVKEFITQMEPEIIFTNVESPRAAIELLRSKKFDCVISDYKMPESDGIQLAQQIRQISRIPIILYTGQGSEEVAEQAYAVGINDYIRKESHPAHYQVLAQRIKQAVEKQRSDSQSELYKKKLEALHSHIICLEQATAHEQVTKATLDAVESVLGFHLLSCLHVQGDKLTSIGHRGYAKHGFSIPLNGKGISVKAAREQRAIIVSDVRANPDFFMGDSNTLSELAVPIIIDGETLGVINVESYELGAFTEEDKHLLEILSSHVALTVKKLRMLEAERSISEKLENIQSNAIKLSQSTSIDDALDTACKILSKDFGYTWVGIGKVDEEAIRYVRVIGTDIGENNVIPLDRRSVAVRAVKSGDSQLVLDSSKEEDYLTFNREGIIANSELVLPIHVNGRVEFVINLESVKINAFSDEDRHLIELLSMHLGSAIELIRKREKLTSLHLHASRLALSTDVEDIAKLTLATLKDVLNFNNCSFHIVNEKIIELIGSVGFTVMSRFTQDLDGPGLIPYTIREGRPIYAPDVSRDEHYVKGPLTIEGVSSCEFVVPIILGGVPVAAINLEDKRINGFTGEDMELVETLSEHVALAIHRIRLLGSMKRYTANLEALNKHARNLSYLPSIDMVARYSFDIMEKVLGFADGAFGVIEDGCIKFIYARNIPVTLLPKMPLNGRGITVRAVKTGETQLVHNTSLDPDFVRDIESSDQYSELDVPVKVDGRVVAVINLEKDKLDAFTDEDKRIVEILSEHVASVISKNEQLGAIRASEDKYRKLLDSSFDGIILLSGTEIIYANNSIRTLLGYDSTSELIGQDVTKTLPEEEKERVRNRTLRRQRGDTEPSRYELRLLRKDGKIIETETATSLIEYEGKPAVLALTRDVSETKRFERQVVALHDHAASLSHASSVKEVCQSTLDAVESVIGFHIGTFLIVEGNYLVSVYNHGCLTFDPIFLNGKSITAKAARERRSILVGDVRNDPDYLRGTIDSLSELAVPVILDGETVAVLNFESLELNAFDEVDQKLLETLAVHVSSAMYRIREMAKLREQEQKKTMELMEGANKIVSMVRHDLRRPLQTIQNATYLINSRLVGAEEYTRKIDSAVEYTVKILDDLKVMMGPQKLKKEVLELNILVKDCLMEMNIAAPIHIEAKLGVPIIAEVDSYKIRRVIENLVKNAIEAMPNGGTLSIKVEADEEVAILAIGDTGQGIPEEVAQNLFTPFFTTKPGGIGLGLTICKQVIEAHSGKITLDSTVGKGTTFTVTLPLKENSAEIDHERVIQVENIEKIRS